MSPRCQPAILALLTSGQTVSKYEAAERIHCDQRTAQRILCSLWLNGYARIDHWTHRQGAPIPHYAAPNGTPDAYKPAAYEPKILKRKVRAARKAMLAQLPPKVSLGILGI